MEHGENIWFFDTSITKYSISENTFHTMQHNFRKHDISQDTFQKIQQHFTKPFLFVIGQNPKTLCPGPASF